MSRRAIRSFPLRIRTDTTGYTRGEAWLRPDFFGRRPGRLLRDTSFVKLRMRRAWLQNSYILILILTKDEASRPGSPSIIHLTVYWFGEEKQKPIICEWEMLHCDTISIDDRNPESAMADPWNAAQIARAFGRGKLTNSISRYGAQAIRTSDQSEYHPIPW